MSVLSTASDREGWELSSRQLSASRGYMILLAGVNILVIAAAVVFFDKWDAFAAVLRSVDLTIVLVIVAFAMLNYLLRAIRYRYLNAEVGAPIPFRHAFLFYVAGFSFSVTPGKVGELVRAWYIRQAYGYPLQKLAPVIFVDRLSDVLATLLLCFFTLSLFADRFIPVAAATVLFAAGLALLMKPKLMFVLFDRAMQLAPRYQRMIDALRSCVSNVALLLSMRSLGFSIGMGLLAWLAEGVAFYFCVRYFGGDISLAAAVFIFAFANLVGGLTFLPGGIGGTEITMLTLLYSLNVPPEIAMAATVLIRASTLWFGVAVGFGASVIASRGVRYSPPEPVAVVAHVRRQQGASQ